VPETDRLCCPARQKSGRRSRVVDTRGESILAVATFVWSTESRLSFLDRGFHLNSAVHISQKIISPPAAKDILGIAISPTTSAAIHNTDPLERLNKENQARSNVVGIFPNPRGAAARRGILLEQDDEWASADAGIPVPSRCAPEPPALSTMAQELMTAIA
jgi:hypothetical protein